MWISSFLRRNSISLVLGFFFFFSSECRAFPSLNGDEGLKNAVIRNLISGSSYFELKNAESVERFAIEFTPQYHAFKKSHPLEGFLNSQPDFFGSHEDKFGRYESKSFLVFHSGDPVFEFSLIHFDSSMDGDLSDFDIFQNRNTFNPKIGFILNVNGLVNRRAFEILSSLNPEIAHRIETNERAIADFQNYEFAYIEANFYQLGKTAESLGFSLPNHVLMKKANLDFQNEVGIQCKELRDSQEKGLQWLKSNRVSVGSFVKRNISPQNFQDLPEWLFVKVLNENPMNGVPLLGTQVNPGLRSFCQKIAGNH